MNNSGLTKKKSVFVFIVYITIFIAAFVVRTRAFYLTDNTFQPNSKIGFPSDGEYNVPLGDVLSLGPYCDAIGGECVVDPSCGTDSDCYTDHGVQDCTVLCCEWSSSSVVCSTGSWECEPGNPCKRRQPKTYCSGTGGGCTGSTGYNYDNCAVTYHCSAGSCVSGRCSDSIYSCTTHSGGVCDGKRTDYGCFSGACDPVVPAVLTDDTGCAGLTCDTDSAAVCDTHGGDVCDGHRTGYKCNAAGNSCDGYEIDDDTACNGLSCGSDSRSCTGGCSQNCACSGSDWRCNTATDKSCTEYCNAAGTCVDCTPSACSKESCGCCQGSACSAGNYCKQSNHACTALPTCKVRVEAGFGYTDAAADTDPENDCGTTDCYTGNCDGAGACKVYSGSEEGACAACYECNDADSACDYVASNTQDTTGSNTCSGTCQVCDGAGVCSDATVDTDPNNDCDVGSWSCTASNCRRQRDSGNCDGAGACKVNDETENCGSGTYCSGGSCVSGSEGELYGNCDDGSDNDCDGSIDCDDSGCADSDHCSPQMTSFSFSTSLEQINVNWITESGAGGTVDVECTFNGVQNCEPFPYSSEPGGGSCTITAPQYDMTPATGETRTVENTLYCKAYDHDNPSLYSETTRTIYPLSFEIIVPLSLGPVVGEEQNLVLTVKNNGTFSDGYTISVVSANPQLLIIENGEQSTQLLGTNDAQQIYVGVTLLSAEESVNANIVVSSNTSRDYTEIKYEQTAAIKGTDKILPDFSIFGIFQIMLIAAALVSFLF